MTMGTLFDGLESIVLEMEFHGLADLVGKTSRIQSVYIADRPIHTMKDSFISTHP